MKRIYLYTVLLGLLCFFSCEDEKTPQLTLKAPAELQALSQSDYVFNKDNAADPFKISWIPADFGFQAVVSYTVMLTNKDNQKSVKLGETPTSSLELTNARMNSLLGELGAYPGKASNFAITLDYSAYSGKLDSTAANTAELKITAYDPKAADWNYIYVATGYPEWDWTKAYKLGDPDGDGLYEGYAYFDTDGATFAILDGKDVATVLTQGKEVAAKGFYKLTYATGGDVEISAAPIKWGLIGDATQGGWNADTEMEYDAESQLWKIVTHLNTGKEFKFRGNNDWGINMGAIVGETPNMGGSLIAGGENIKLTAPSDTVYQVTLNLTNAGQYTYLLEVTSAEQSSEALYMPGSYQADGGWKPEMPDCFKLGSPARDFIYSGAYFVPANTEFKFTDGPNWGSEFAIVKDTKISWNEDKSKGEFNIVTSGGDNILVEPAGYYKITVNVKKMTAVFQKTGWEVIGDATPGGWDKGTVMDFNPEKNTWSISVDLTGGKMIKFRWDGGWDINLGGSLGALTQGGADIPVGSSGKYTITLDPDAKTATMTNK